MCVWGGGCHGVFCTLTPCTSLSPRACGGLHAQWHHHWGELLPSSPGRVDGAGAGVLWKGWATQSFSCENERNPGDLPQYTFIASRASPVLEPSLGGLPNSRAWAPAGIHLSSATERCSDVIVNIPIDPPFYCPGSLSGMKAPTLTMATLVVGRQGREWPLETAIGSG